VTSNTPRDEIASFEWLISSHEISPELVLVDPELGRVARDVLRREAEELAATHAAPVEVEPAREQPITPLYYALDPPQPVVATAPPIERTVDRVVARPSRVLSLTAPSILSVSILLNLMLAGVLFAGSGETPELLPPEPAFNQAPSTQSAERPAAAPTATAAPRQSRAGGHPAARPPHRSTGRARASRMKATAERTVLALVGTAPRSRVAQLIDGKTGLLKNNIQAVCRRRAAQGAGRFLCIVRPAGAPRNAGLYVSYTVQPRGRWSVTWLGYRKG
jgi:hypothetical protein